jgi:hypothetical protein
MHHRSEPVAKYTRTRSSFLFAYFKNAECKRVPGDVICASDGQSDVLFFCVWLNCVCLNCRNMTFEDAKRARVYAAQCLTFSAFCDHLTMDSAIHENMASLKICAIIISASVNKHAYSRPVRFSDTTCLSGSLPVLGLQAQSMT